jgi:hypothetical protein
MGTVKAAKAAARHMREGGQRPKAASAAALQAVGVKKQQKHGVAKRGRHESIDDDDASEGPEAKLACLAATTSRVYAGVLLQDDFYDTAGVHHDKNDTISSFKTCICP